MRTRLSTQLNCPPSQAWKEIKTTRLLLKSFGFLPLGRQYIVIGYLQGLCQSGREECCVRDNGFGTLARRWDHLVSPVRTKDGQTLWRWIMNTRFAEVVMAGTPTRRGMRCITQIICLCRKDLKTYL
jgi:hypothetical protein